MTPKETAEYMFGKDFFSQWLGIELIDIKENYCFLKMPVKPEMINGLGTVHGGVTFAFADSALAFSSNNTGDAAVALNCYINFTMAIFHMIIYHSCGLHVCIHYSRAHKLKPTLFYFRYYLRAWLVFVLYDMPFTLVIYAPTWYIDRFKTIC